MFEEKNDAGEHTIFEVACWAHARRYFFDSQGTSHKLAVQALFQIRKLYKVEESIKGKSDEDKFAARQKHSKPLLDKFYNWMEAAETEREVLPKSRIQKAINYVKKNWPAFTRYTEQGYLDIDNNAAERAIKSVVIGRKNWLFAGSEEGGKTAAIAYSLIESAKSSGANVWEWLRFVIENIGQTPKNRLSELLPDQWVSNQQESTPS